MKIKQLTALLVSIVLPICVLADSPTTYQKSGVKIGDNTYDVRYLEYEHPLHFNKLIPVEGTQPGWAKTSEVIEEFYNYDYQEVADCFTADALKFNGLTEETFNKMKEQRLSADPGTFPENVKRSLISELYLKSDDHEYLVVQMDDYAWLDNISDKKSHGVRVILFEKVDGHWKNAICPLSKWENDLPKTSEELKDLLK